MVIVSVSSLTCGPVIESLTDAGCSTPSIESSVMNDERRSSTSNDGGITKIAVVSSPRCRTFRAP